MLEQYDEMLALYGTQTGVNLARKHIGWYTKGLPGSAELRNTRQPAGRSGGGRCECCANSIRPGWRAPPPERSIAHTSVFLMQRAVLGPLRWMRVRPIARDSAAGKLAPAGAGERPILRPCGAG